MESLRLEEYTLGHLMTEGHLTEYRFSPQLVAILCKADANENMDICLELTKLDDVDDDYTEHYHMPEDSEHILVTEWCSIEESNEPGVWSIFMFRDPVTKSTRMIGWICDGHCYPYLRKII